MTVLHIDFETRSTVDLRETGAHVYMEDATTDIWCAAYAFDDGPVELWTPGAPCPREIREHVESGGELAAWNAQFERLGWRHILTPRYGWPEPKLEQFRCVMAEAMAMSLPGALENAAPAVGIKEEKDQVGKRIMLQMSRPRKIENGQITWWNDSEKLTRLYEYCKQDVEVERQIEKRLVRLSPSERRVWLLDQAINDRGIHVDIPLCRAALKVVAEATKKLDAEMTRVTDHEVTACSQVSRLIVWLGKNGVDTKSVAKAELTDLLGRDDLQPPVRRALELRQQAAKASTAKIETLLAGVSRDGTVKGLLQYHGAGRTGRWAGRRFQPQNLPRSSIKISESDIDLLRGANTGLIDLIYGSPLAFVSDCIRSLLVAAPGHELLAADFSNIEGRVLAWLAGQTDKVRIFAANGPIYERMAARIYGVPVEQIEDPSPERQLGKAAELGCIAEGTPVLTPRGLVPIESVTKYDLLWDGDTWVTHQGLVHRGVKDVIHVAGLWLTPDHYVLSGDRWQPAQSLAHDADIRTQALATGSDSLQSLVSGSGSAAGAILSELSATAERLNTAQMSTIFWRESRPRATSAQSKKLGTGLRNIIATLTRFLMTGTAPGYLTGSHRQSHGATTLGTASPTTTESAAFASIRSGARTGGRFRNMLFHSRAGTTRILRWTERTLTPGTSQAPSGSSAAATTSATSGASPFSKKSVRTYDLKLAGLKNCFTCWGSAGAVVVHNCGFGMGAPKFQETCRKQGIILDKGMAEKTVATFREVNDRVVAMWYDTEDAGIEAVERKGAITECGRVKFRVNGSFLFCKLPSGRNLVYPYPKLIEKETPWGEVKTALAFKGVDTYTRQWGETDTYGAKLVENIVQATARDLMADAMLRLEVAGYPAILTVHDEVIAQVPKGSAAKEDFERIMSIVPAWAIGCPIAAKGWIGRRYRK